MDYDSWKLATPWDDEISISVSFECKQCEFYHDSVEAVAGKRDDYVEVECEECTVMNSVDIGGDW